MNNNCSYKFRLNLLKSIKISPQETTSLFRKYLGPLDIILSSIMGNNKNLHVLRTGQNGPRLAWNALQRHESQFVWYRKLFIVTSRYVYTNTLIEVVL